MKTFRQLLDEIRSFPMTTAYLRAKKHDSIAKKDWEKNGKDPTLKTDRHLRASDRYMKLSQGKKPFSNKGK
jgi:hypothetical protein